MARNHGFVAPPGWKVDGWLRYKHDTGASVFRDPTPNPATEIIEWAAIPNGGDPVYCGQDLNSAFAIALGE